MSRLLRLGPLRHLGVLGSVLLVVGSYAYTRLPYGTSEVHLWNHSLPLLEWWRGLDGARWIGSAVAAVGLVLLTIAWVDLVRRVRGRPEGVATAVVTVVVWSLPLLLAGPIFSGDGWSYVATGYMTGHGLDPYHAGAAGLPAPLSSGVSPGWLNTPTPYGPLPLLWGGAFSRVTSDPWLLLAAYRLLSLLSLLGLAWGIARLARRQGVDPAVAVALACASPFVVAHGIGGLHNDLLVAALGVAALAITREGHWVGAAALVGAAAAVKVPGALFGVGVVLMSLPAGIGLLVRLRRTLQVAAVAGAVLLVSGLPAGLGLGWVSALGVPQMGRVHLATVPMIAAVVRAAADGLGAGGVASVFSVQNALHTATVLSLVAASWVLLRWRTGSSARVLLGAAIALLAATVLSPVVHYWYFLWCVPLLCAVRLPRVWAAAVAAEVAALGLSAVCDPAFDTWWMSALGGIAVFGAPLVAFLLARSRGDVVQIAPGGRLSNVTDE